MYKSCITASHILSTLFLMSWKQWHLRSMIQMTIYVDLSLMILTDYLAYATNYKLFYTQLSEIHCIEDIYVRTALNLWPCLFFSGLYPFYGRHLLPVTWRWLLRGTNKLSELFIASTWKLIYHFSTVVCDGLCGPCIQY